MTVAGLCTGAGMAAVIVLAAVSAAVVAVGMDIGAVEMVAAVLQTVTVVVRL